MTPALLWFLLAAALFLGEIFTTTFFLAALALGAVGAALAGWLGAVLWIQVLIFALGSGIGSLLARPLAERLLHSGTRRLPTHVEALVGSEGRVTASIPVDGYGHVKVRGDDWRAVSDDRAELEAGARVLVTEVEGTTLHVVPYS